MPVCCKSDEFFLKKFLGKEREENAWLWVSNAGTWIEALAPFTWLTALFFQIMVFLTSNNPQLSPGHAWKSILFACPWHLWSTGMCRTYIACGLVSTASMIQNQWLIDWFTYNSTDFYKVFTNCMSTQIKSLVNFQKKVQSLQVWYHIWPWYTFNIQSNFNRLT